MSNIFEKKEEWVGSVDSSYYANYVDLLLVLIFGGIPWQVYFQRVLSAKTEKSAMYLSYIAAFGCFVMAVPSVLIGAIAKSTSKNIKNMKKIFKFKIKILFKKIKIGMKQITMESYRFHQRNKSLFCL